jgi:DNA primase
MCVSISGSIILPGIHFTEVRARIALADVLDLLGFVPCDRSVDQVRGPCLVHRSASPSSRSFSANLKLHIYRCFKCGSSGNQLDLYATVTGLNFFEATVELCEQLHREIPWIYTSARQRTANRFAPDQPHSHDAGASRAGELA